MAARLDLNIDEGATWTMTIDFWENTDRTIPVDMTNQELEGAFLIGTSYIPMTFVVVGNSFEASIPFADLEALPAIRGTYDIEARDNGTNEKYRVIQGDIRVDREVTKDQV